MSNQQSLQELYPKRIDIIILIVLSLILLIVGFSLPVLTVRKLWEKNTFSILSGIVSLWKDGYLFLAIVIFFFSIVFPVAKLTALLSVWFLRMSQARRERLLYWLEALGRWSMLDVFVIAILIVAIKLGALAKAKAEPGIYFFGASILLAMIATGLQGRLARSAGRAAKTAVAVAVFCASLLFASAGYACEPCANILTLSETVDKADLIVIGHGVSEGPPTDFGEGYGGPDWTEIQITQVLKGQPPADKVTVNSWDAMCPYGIILTDEGPYVMFLKEKDTPGTPAYEAVDYGCAVKRYPVDGDIIDFEGDKVPIEEFIAQHSLEEDRERMPDDPDR